MRSGRISHPGAASDAESRCCAMRSGRSPLDIDPSYLETRRWRVYVLVAVFATFCGVLTARLIFIQALQSAHFRSMATEEHWRRTVLPPRRGDILDSNGVPLATSVPFQSLYAATSEIRNTERVAAALAPLLDESPALLEAKLSAKQLAPVLIKRWLPDDVASRVSKLGFDGLFLQIEPRRVYPQGTLAAQLLGVVGVDNNGLSGLELEFNSDIAGKPGELVAERDTAGDAIALGPHQYTPPVDGSTITLTVDRYVEWVAERELQAAIRQYGARGGSIVILDPRTGAVLAMAGAPSFRPDDPNLYSEENIAHYNIPGVSSAYEPGSIFKVITMAAALDTGTVAPDTAFVDPGVFTYDGGTIHNASPRPLGLETMTQTLIYSSNVGASWAAARVGATNFYRYVQAFGFGKPTGIELPGEANGTVRLPSDPVWFPFDLVTNAFGQGISVTPLQMAVAVAAIANGGTLLKPYVVQKVSGPDGTRVYYPTVRGQVIHQETAANLTRMLVAVVDDPKNTPASAARVPGYSIAGKPGTAEVPGDNGYSKTDTIASFVGYAPAEAPRFVIVVRIDGPREPQGSDAAAARVFGAIARQLLQYYQIPPNRPDGENGT